MLYAGDTPVAHAIPATRLQLQYQWLEDVSAAVMCQLTDTQPAAVRLRAADRRLTVLETAGQDAMHINSARLLQMHHLSLPLFPPHYLHTSQRICANLWIES